MKIKLMFIFKEMNMIYDIAFIVLVTTLALWLIWEFIPDPTKKYWHYIWMVRKDRKLGQHRKYIFSFRNGVGREK